MLSPVRCECGIEALAFLFSLFSFAFTLCCLAMLFDGVTMDNDAGKYPEEREKLLFRKRDFKFKFICPVRANALNTVLMLFRVNTNSEWLEVVESCLL